MTQTEGPTDGADLNGKILWSLARWVEDKHGAETLKRICDDAAVSPEQFEGATHWLSLASVERFLSGVRELVPNDEAFLRACEHRFKETYGAVRFLVWALSEQKFFEMAATRGTKMMTRISRVEILRLERNEFHCRYHSTKKESRLLCLTRHASWTKSPLMWNMPPAQLEETACIAHGDPYCEYHLRWYDRSRAAPIVGGAAAGAVAAGLLFAFHATLGAVATSFILPLLGAALGYIYELRRTQHVNFALAQEIQQVLGDVARDEAEARSEIATLNQRQREWLRFMEQQVAERSANLERVLAGVASLQQNRVSTMRGFSHDLRNPLFVVRGNTQFLKERVTEAEAKEALDDMELAAHQIEEMLARLMAVASQDSEAMRFSAREILVPPLVDSLRRRLRALVHGRDIKVSVFCTREAPESVMMDPLVFDRIVDNLLTNAAKYTHRGSVLLEITGTVYGSRPGDGEPTAVDYLTLKLSDTGEGIPSEAIDRIFRPRPANETSPRADSLGVGLSGVVRLLAQIGGRLDVLSKPGMGTTFWAHLPVTPPPLPKRNLSEENLESMITRVVTIRRVENG